MRITDRQEASHQCKKLPRRLKLHSIVQKWIPMLLKCRKGRNIRFELFGYYNDTWRYLGTFKPTGMNKSIIICTATKVKDFMQDSNIDTDLKYRLLINKCSLRSLPEITHQVSLYIGPSQIVTLWGCK